MLISEIMVFWFQFYCLRSKVGFQVLVQDSASSSVLKIRKPDLFFSFFEHFVGTLILFSCRFNIVWPLALVPRRNMTADILF